MLEKLKKINLSKVNPMLKPEIVGLMKALEEGKTSASAEEENFDMIMQMIKNETPEALEGEKETAAEKKEEKEEAKEKKTPTAKKSKSKKSKYEQLKDIDLTKIDDARLKAEIKGIIKAIESGESTQADEKDNIKLAFEILNDVNPELADGAESDEDEPKEKKTATKKAAPKAAKKVAKKTEPKAEKKKNPTCAELKKKADDAREAARLRRENKTTKPISSTLADKVSSTVKTAIKYKADKGEIDVKDLRKVVDKFTNAYDNMVSYLGLKPSSSLKKQIDEILKEVADKQKG